MTEELAPLPTHALPRSRLDRNALQAQVDAVQQGIAVLRQYLTSSEFTCMGALSGFVHTSEVLVRLSEALSLGTEALNATYDAARVVDCDRSGTAIEQYNPDALGDEYRCPGCGRWLQAAVNVPPFWPTHAPTEDGEEARARALSRPPAFGAETRDVRLARLIEERSALVTGRAA